MSFEDLSIPESTELASGNIKWLVRGTVTPNLYLIATCVLADVASRPVEDFLFNTEIGAHVYASIYYKDYNRPYPYKDEWDAAILKDVAAAPAPVQINQSQVMEFI